MPIITPRPRFCGKSPFVQPRTKLTDMQWRLIRDHLPGKKGDPGRTGFDNRMSLEGMLWVIRTGAPWRDLPARFGNWNTVYWRFRRWIKAGVFDLIFAVLTADRDLTTVMVDGTFAKVHQHAAGARKLGETAETSKKLQKIGRSMGGLTTKLIAVTSIDGRLVDFSSHPGNAAEAPCFVPLVANLDVQEVLADKAYDSDEIRSTLAARKITAVIPSKSNRKVSIPHDEKRYEKRHMIENYFSYIKHFRGVATRYCKLDETYSAFVKMAAWVIETR